MINLQDFHIDGIDREDDSDNWIVTFADLMAILLTFFILLLSFSEIDVQKYRDLRVRMNEAFSTVPATPVRIAPPSPVSLAQPVILAPPIAPPTHSEKQNDSEAVEAWMTAAEKLASELAADIDIALIEVESNPSHIIIRLREQAIFESGSADVNPEYDRLLERIADSINPLEGRIRIAGHTDDQPISSTRYRSNWDLSSARAVTVAHFLMAPEDADETRYEVSGFADTQPLAANDSEEHRALNRRVEVMIIRATDDN
jgi:chemotaxis protein MotB